MFVCGGSQTLIGNLPSLATCIMICIFVTCHISLILSKQESFKIAVRNVKPSAFRGLTLTGPPGEWELAELPRTPVWLSGGRHGVGELRGMSRFFALGCVYATRASSQKMVQRCFTGGHL